jgi:hypothetical protein
MRQRGYTAPAVACGRVPQLGDEVLRGQTDSAQYRLMRGGVRA